MKFFRFKKMHDVLLVCFLITVIITLPLEVYELTHILFSIFLLTIVVVRKSLNTKFLALFLFLYYFLPFLNISTYRGIISFETLQLYTIGITCILLPFLFSVGNFPEQLKPKPYTKLVVTRRLIEFVLVHILIVYALLGYVYLTLGNIIVNQELRFFLNPKVAYILKSTLYIPLFIVFFDKSQFSKKNILFFIILPLIPPFFIGSRGTVLIIIMSLMILFILKGFPKNRRYYLQNSDLWKKYKFKIYRYGFLSFLLIQITYYTRRIFSDEFISTNDLVMLYFSKITWYYVLIAPLYFSLRETVGITEKIVSKNAYNKWFDYPIFFSEIATLLPGEQISPGILLSQQLYNSSGRGGITPGIFGALYMDFKYGTVVILFLISMLIYYFYKKSFFSDINKILYVLTLTQFLHLYHRGFFKFEYLVAYIIVLFYISVARFEKVKE